MKFRYYLPLGLFREIWQGLADDLLDFFIPVLHYSGIKGKNGAESSSVCHGWSTQAKGSTPTDCCVSRFYFTASKLSSATASLMSSL